MTTPHDRHDRLDRMIAEDRIIRRAWTDGHDRACLLAALAPECGRYERAAACPADLMPAWMAQLTPSMDDYTSAAYWPDMIRAYARLSRRWRVLDAASWDRVLTAHLLRCLTLAREGVTVDEWGALPAIDEVSRLLREGGTDEEWRAAEAATEAAAGAAAEAAQGAALAARAVAEAARVARASWPARAAARAARAADAAAQDAAWDHIARGLLADIELEIDHE